MPQNTHGWLVHRNLFLTTGIIGMSTSGVSSILTTICIVVQRIGKFGQFCVTWPCTSHKAHVGGHDFVGDLGSFLLVFMRGGEKK